MSLYLLAGNSITVCQTLRKDGAAWAKFLGSDELYVRVGFLLAAVERLPRPKVKEKIFGYDADEFMAKQYK